MALSCATQTVIEADGKGAKVMTTVDLSVAVRAAVSRIRVRTTCGTRSRACSSKYWRTVKAYVRRVCWPCGGICCDVL